MKRRFVDMLQNKRWVASGICVSRETGRDIFVFKELYFKVKFIWSSAISIVQLLIWSFIVIFRPSMSYGTMLRDNRFVDSRELIFATTEELVKKLGGTKNINKVVLIFVYILVIVLWGICFDSWHKWLVWLGVDCKQRYCSGEMYAFHSALGVRSVSQWTCH